ncbi:MAG: hypothetical protein JWM86_1011, partial [Thermoleophilia bacterium]|nr:hypothetical protein [Thermoleophilia bacterium]
MENRHARDVDGGGVRVRSDH